MKPSAQTRNFHWDKIANQKVSNTIWIRKNIAEKTATTPLDFEKLEEVFGIKAATATISAGTEGKSGEDDSNKEAKQKIVSFLDPKRQQKVCKFISFLPHIPLIFF